MFPAINSTRVSVTEMSVSLTRVRTLRFRSGSCTGTAVTLRQLLQHNCKVRLSNTSGVIQLGDTKFEMRLKNTSVDKKNQLDVTFRILFSLLIVAQNVSGNHVPIIRS